MPERLHLLHYEYVDDILDKRGPHREAHLAHAAAWKADGRLRFGGAVGDPPRGGLLIFDASVPVEDIERFAADDPYVHAGLVTARRVEPWLVVV